MAYCTTLHALKGYKGDIIHISHRHITHTHHTYTHVTNALQNARKKIVRTCTYTLCQYASMVSQYDFLVEDVSECSQHPCSHSLLQARAECGNQLHNCRGGRN